ncbi:uncharacterized protein LY79DRAFT_572598 [Colletotrichum navitas]|uniref:Uncharacterized protein n=1 Tax=Colletotrichum navitas TaxID=681940 RepID=A0AAD8UXV1_9PEZI|nr:uncharacterized protein LY79DRAFT_572598 [Colletotrichum navitas]KAK1566179.1 hypothetical protein LY79DRAFT_572598 [Colletotrichum navitas]
MKPLMTVLVITLTSTACAALNQETPVFLETREPVRRPKLRPGRPNRWYPCKEVGGHCSSSSDCCGSLLCSRSHSCYESRF